MTPDLDNILLHSSYNAFKNNGVHRADIAMPNSYTANTPVEITETFTLADDTDFAQVLIYGTDYAKYFRYLDSQYHDAWMQIEQPRDFLLLDNPVTQLFYFYAKYRIVGDQITIVITIPKFSSSFNILSTLSVPVAVVEYTLAR